MYLEVEMERVQRQINQDGLSPNLQHLKSTLRRELEERYQQEETMFHQKFRMLWLKEGDKNTKLFHNSFLQHMNHNWIHSLKIEEGAMVESHEDVEHNLRNYFSTLLSDSPSRHKGNHQLNHTIYF